MTYLTGAILGPGDFFDKTNSWHDPTAWHPANEDLRMRSVAFFLGIDILQHQTRNVQISEVPFTFNNMSHRVTSHLPCTVSLIK